MFYLENEDGLFWSERQCNEVDDLDHATVYPTANDAAKSAATLGGDWVVCEEVN